MRILLQGLWSRRGLNAATFLLAVTALAASLVGPMYGTAAAEHLLDTRVKEWPAYVTGLSWSSPALGRGELPLDDPSAYQPPDPRDVIASASAEVTGGRRDEYWEPPTPWLIDRAGRLAFGKSEFEVPLYWREGMCDLVTLQGRCPAARGEVLVQQEMAASLGKQTGDTLTLQFVERWFETGDGVRVERERSFRRTFSVVGTYQAPDPESRAWYDASPVAAPGDLVTASAVEGFVGAPALLVSPETMTSQTFVGGADRPLDLTAADVEDLGRVGPVIQENVVGLQRLGESSAAATDATLLLEQVRDERARLTRVTAVAVAPLVVLALLLLHALVSAAAEVRRPFVALAKLRGHSRGQVFRFGVAEPVLVIGLAVPVALAAAWLAVRVVSRWWLAPGAPVALDGLALVSLLTVTAAATATAALAVVTVLREPLSAALTSDTRAGGPSRWSLVLRAGVIALAVGGSLQLMSAEPGRSGQVIELLTPLFVALALGVAGISGLALLARRWSAATQERGGTAAFLASRRLARRQDLARIMVPILLAVTVLTFATSASATAEDWRVSRAQARVGAPVTYDADADPSLLLQVTRDVDPEGRYLAAAVVEKDPRRGMARRVLVDVSRLAEVVAWNRDWSSVPVEELQRRLTPRNHVPALTVRGRELELRLEDVRLRSDGPAVLWLRYRTSAGRQVGVPVGDLVNGRTQVLSVMLEDCDEPCVVEQVSISGSSASMSDAQGELRVAGVSVDGRRADWGLDRDGRWRPARPFPFSMVDPPVALEPTAEGLGITVYLHQPPPVPGSAQLELSGYAGITPADVPDAVPVLVTGATRTSGVPPPVTTLGSRYPGGVTEGFALNGEKTPMRVVGTVRALPGVGDEGAMSDLEASLREFAPPGGVAAGLQLWTSAGTPPAMIEAVESAGITLSNRRSVEETVADLSTDAFSLAWRIFLLVGIVTLALALFGVLAAAAVQTRSRTYEVAALRVVGVRERVLVGAAAQEYLVALATAVVLGVAAAVASTLLVLPVLDLGTAAPDDPAPTVSVHWRTVLAVGLGMLTVTGVVSLLMSLRAVRRAAPAVLRSDVRT